MTVTKFVADLDKPVETQLEMRDKGFQNRVISTLNFDLETSK